MMDAFTLQQSLTLEQRAQLAAEIFSYGMAMCGQCTETHSEHHQFIIGMIPTICMAQTSADEKTKISEEMERILGTGPETRMLLMLAGVATLKHAVKQHQAFTQGMDSEAAKQVASLLAGAGNAPMSGL